MINIQKLSQTKLKLLQLQDIFKVHLQESYISDTLSSILIELSIDNIAFIESMFQQIFIIIDQFEELSQSKMGLEVRVQGLIEDNYRMKEREEAYRDVIEELESRFCEIGIKSSSNSKGSIQQQYQTIYSRMSSRNVPFSISNSHKPFTEKEQTPQFYQTYSFNNKKQQQTPLQSQNMQNLPSLLQMYHIENQTLKTQLKLKQIQIQLAMIILQEQRSKYIKISDYQQRHETTPLKPLSKSNSYPTFTSFNHDQSNSKIIKRHSLMQDLIQSHLQFIPIFQDKDPGQGNDHGNVKRQLISQQTSQSNCMVENGRLSKGNSTNNKANSKSKGKGKSKGQMIKDRYVNIKHHKAINVSLLQGGGGGRETKSFGLQVTQKSYLNHLYCKIYQRVIINRIKT